MSHVDDVTFEVCISMQNVRLLIKYRGLNIYVCTCIENIDENYIVAIIDTSKGGRSILSQYTSYTIKNK